MITLSIKEIASMIDGELILNSMSADEMVKGVCIDSRKIEEANMYIPLLGEKVDGHKFIKDVEKKGAVLTLCSDDQYIPEHMALIKVKDTLQALQQLACNYRKSLSCKVIGITGSNGKTSCKDILAGALSAKFKTQKTQGNKNNEIGVPLTLLSLDNDVEVAVIEMGMENREEIHFLNKIVAQDIAIITNVGIAHLENLGSIENIGKAKLEIVDDLKQGSLFIYNGDDQVLDKLMETKRIPEKVQVETFGNSKKNGIYLTSLTQDENGIYFSTNLSGFTYHIEILGEHQALNALAAIVVARNLGLSEEEIQRGFLTMEKTSMRNELMHINKCTILNDAYKSNPQSAKAALATFHMFKHPYKMVVLADMLDLGNTTFSLHHDLGFNLSNYGLQEILCMGDLAKYIEEGARQACPDAIIHHFEDRESLFVYLKDYVNKDCMILFKGSRGMALDLVIDKMKEYGDEHE
ncbi:MAG: UDP-N-acetylmuramoyl-tripeptide--D-alanyl-D-alanine ligase [Bacilli bacterium]|nr:UDP-N-acetylmuramoyl-tripeptide--D-alanyl-D-alanine ligase [Bacilli bacterium]